MYYYVIGNKNYNEITTSSERYNSLLSKKTCHKRFKNKTDAAHFLKVFNKYFKQKYNAFVDFEFTCSMSKKDFKYPEIQSEVLSIGICITDNQGNIIDSFYNTVKPKYNDVLTPYCISLTHLKQEEINNSKDLISVFKEATAFLKQYHIGILNAFGTSDYNQTKTDIDRFKNNEDYPMLLKLVNKITNIQPEIISCLIGFKQEISLEDAKNLCGISGSVKHNALSDAEDLSKVVFATFFNPPSEKKILKYIEQREKHIKYKQLRHFKTHQLKLSNEDKEKFLEVCEILENNFSNNIKVEAFIDDLLFLSGQELKFKY